VTPLKEMILNAGRISGGFNSDSSTEYGEFPWHCAILTVDAHNEDDINYVCGGTLIHSNIVLTAAHCVSDLGHRRLLVDCGDYNLNNLADEQYPVIRSHVADVNVHPEFNPLTSKFDAALLLLDSSTPHGKQPNIGNVCLSRPAEINLKVTEEMPADAPIGTPHGEEHPLCYVPGWGYDSYSKTVTSLNPLKKAEMVYVSSEECYEQLSKEPELSEHFRLQHETYCAKGRYGENACKGDGGGAMVCRMERGCSLGLGASHHGCQSDKRWVIAGIVSWGVSCGEGRPSVFQDVRSASMNNWIRGTLAKYGYNHDLEP